MLSSNWVRLPLFSQLFAAEIFLVNFPPPTSFHFMALSGHELIVSEGQSWKTALTSNYTPEEMSLLFDSNLLVSECIKYSSYIQMENKTGTLCTTSCFLSPPFCNLLYSIFWNRMVKQVISGSL